MNYDPPKGKDIIVSQLIAQYLVDHKGDYPDIGMIFTPDTGTQNAVRNDKGQIIGTLVLSKYN